MKSKLPKMVCVQWNDAYHNDGAFGEDEIADKAHSMESFAVGFLLERTKDSVKICSEYFPDNYPEYRKLQVVPMGMVKKITVIKGGK